MDKLLENLVDAKDDLQKEFVDKGTELVSEETEMEFRKGKAVREFLETAEPEQILEIYREEIDPSISSIDEDYDANVPSYRNKLQDLADSDEDFLSRVYKDNISASESKIDEQIPDRSPRQQPAGRMMPEPPEDEMPEEELTINDEEPLPDAEAPKKEYIGHKEDTHFYLISNLNDMGDTEDLQIVNQEGEKVFSASEQGMEVTDVFDFLMRAIQETDMEFVATSVIEKYILPKLAEPPMEEEEPFPQDEELEGIGEPERPEVEGPVESKIQFKGKKIVAVLEKNVLKLNKIAFPFSKGFVNMFESIEELAKNTMSLLSEEEVAEVTDVEEPYFFQKGAPVEPSKEELPKSIETMERRIKNLKERSNSGDLYEVQFSISDEDYKHYRSKPYDLIRSFWEYTTIEPHMIPDPEHPGDDKYEGEEMFDYSVTETPEGRHLLTFKVDGSEFGRKEGGKLDLNSFFRDIELGFDFEEMKDKKVKKVGSTGVAEARMGVDYMKSMRSAMKTAKQALKDKDYEGASKALEDCADDATDAAKAVKKMEREDKAKEEAQV